MLYTDTMPEIWMSIVDNSVGYTETRSILFRLIIIWCADKYGYLTVSYKGISNDNPVRPKKLAKDYTDQVFKYNVSLWNFKKQCRSYNWRIVNDKTNVNYTHVLSNFSYMYPGLKLYNGLEQYHREIILLPAFRSSQCQGFLLCICI